MTKPPLDKLSEEHQWDLWLFGELVRTSPAWLNTLAGKMIDIGLLNNSRSPTSAGLLFQGLFSLWLLQVSSFLMLTTTVWVLAWSLVALTNIWLWLFMGATVLARIRLRRQRI